MKIDKLNKKQDKLYFFGYYTGIFLLLVSGFFIFSMIIFYEKMVFLDFLLTSILCIICILYFFKYTIYYLSYELIDNEMLIYDQKKLICKFDYNKCKINKIILPIQKELVVEDKQDIRKMIIDYDVFDRHLSVTRIDKEKRLLRNRKTYYIIYGLMTILIVLAIIYALNK